MEKDPNVCCHEFNPTPWENKEHIWKDKLFLKDTVVQLFHIPLNMGSVVSRMWKKIEDANAVPDMNEFLMLSYDPSPWKAEMYMTVSKEIDGEEHISLSGKYISKVFDGQFNEVPNWIAEFDKYLERENKKAIKYYFYYTTCPKCAKKYGHNYVVLFAKID
jgi:hypothetical protein